MTDLQPMRVFFKSGNTLSYEFRRNQLHRLKKSILDHEKELYHALYSDLKKSREESWVTEVGFVIAEINHTLRKLKKWMDPEKAATNLLNFPSKSFIYKEPLGVILIIGPWNYPFQLLLTPVIGAIAAGNCVVMKPSEFAGETSATMGKIICETFPPEYIRYQTGEGATIVPRMINDFRFDHIFYTGSTHVGRMIYEMAAHKLIPVTLELGGKSPCIVEEDANIRVAAKRIALTKFSNVGQMCVAPDFLLVHENIKERLVASLVETIKAFFSEDASTSHDYGRIINEKQFHRLVKYINEGTIVFGGKHDASSRFIEPTILENVSIDKAVMGEEIFGPVLPVLTFRTHEEAREIINRHPDPLALYVFTESREKEKLWLEKVSFGGGCINNASWHLTNFNLPFGGRGNSGIGAYHGKYSFDVFTHHKSIMKTPTWFDPKIKYPPFKGKLGLFKKIVN
jgi:aldehyde dehydrogenase (NAD+)